MREEQTAFITAEDYLSKDKIDISFRQIVLKHLFEIRQYASKEWRGGYWERRVKSDHTEEYYVPDTREVYCNAIDYLSDLLLPVFDDKVLKEIDKNKKKYEEIYRKTKNECEDKDTQYFNQTWLRKKVIIKRELFQQLSLLLHRLRYLEGKIFEQ